MIQGSSYDIAHLLGEMKTVSGLYSRLEEEANTWGKEEELDDQELMLRRCAHQAEELYTRCLHLEEQIVHRINQLLSPPTGRKEARSHPLTSESIATASLPPGSSTIPTPSTTCEASAPPSQGSSPVSSSPGAVQKTQEVTKISNPYLQAYQDAQPSSSDPYALACYTKRQALVEKYAWSVPTPEALSTIAKYGPVVEIGAGSGYWAHCLESLGCDVMAYDSHPPDTGENSYNHTISWTTVHAGGSEKAALHSDRTLLLAWPPYGKAMAAETLINYQGDTLVYIGEGRYGCTADDRFFRLLESQWEIIESVHLPQWRGIHDAMIVYRRKK